MISGIDLKVERVRAGATQRDIARYMGISAPRVSAIETDTKHEPSPEMVQRYRDAVAAYITERESGEPTRWRVEMVGGQGNVQDQYKAAKAQARSDVRRYPSHRVIEVQIEPDTPAATVIGYLDGLAASGVSPVLLDWHGTVVNRRIG
jgi:transcriptional regulator with XRE-family HTH domain